MIKVRKDIAMPIERTRKKIWHAPPVLAGMFAFRAVVTEWRWRGWLLARRVLYREDGRCYACWMPDDLYMRIGFIDRD